MKLFSIFLTILAAAAIITFSPADVMAAETVIKTDPDQPISATLSFSAAPLRTMTEIPFVVALGKDIVGDPQIHSAVCALTMPAMAMPDNQPDLNCGTDSCKGTAVFTMAGTWQATFGLVMKDGTHTSFVFNIDMVKMK